MSRPLRTSVLGVPEAWAPLPSILSFFFLPLLLSLPSLSHSPNPYRACFFFAFGTLK